jgi:hypothetical protein
VSGEHDRYWAKSISTRLKKSGTIHVRRDKTEYIQEITRNGFFDLIVLDGMYRDECVLPSLAFLKKSGVIVWDDTDRQEYRKGMDFLFERGFLRISFFGCAPITFVSKETSIYYRRDGNILGI